jgi:hypothetical protein
MKRAWRVLAWCGGGVALSSGALLACVLADPPPLQELPPASRPLIIGSSASPPLGTPIGTQPTNQVSISFAANVQIDPGDALQWRVFVDYGAATGGGLVHHGDTVGLDGDGGGTPVTFDIFASDLGDPTRCHTIELDVATKGWTDTNGQNNVPVQPPGGDTAVWMYQPTGNCNVFDAGPSPQPDADASDGADE